MLYNYIWIIFNNCLDIVHYKFCDILQVCFADESILKVLVEKSQFVQPRSNERILAAIKHSLSVMVWSVFSNKAFYIAEGTMKAEKYQKVLLPQIKMVHENIFYFYA